MPTQRRDSAKVPELQDVPARKRTGRPRADKVSRDDFGDLPTPRRAKPVRMRGQRTDSGPSDAVDLPALDISSSQERSR